jgi:molybdopterin-guanine dinucleotide biosynthesis protein A
LSGPPDVAGAALAGGRARRLGGASKACVALAGRPLVTYPLAALAGAGLARVAVVCKPSTALPSLPEGVERWEEPAEPIHPALGIARALELADGPVLVVATDMPWVGAGECRLLLSAARSRPRRQPCSQRPATGSSRPSGSTGPRPWRY